ncbi:MAG: ATP-binding protein [Sulfurimonadaceae bacterium]|jgi:heavy metal sensor kinase|nr:ATP-binding protein [Arcobacteraceae bacterium]
MNKFSIKQKLLLYNIIIQCIILIVFSFSIYKILEISTLDKIESTLKVIVLDVVDDIIDHQEELSSRVFDEEKEYKFEPLYIRLLKLETPLKVINQTPNFPEIASEFNHLQKLKKDTIDFENNRLYILSRIKITIKGELYIVEVATNNTFLNTAMENLFYILLFIVPIILIFSIIGGYFLIYKSFLPIETILKKLKNITAFNLSKRLDIPNTHDEIGQLSHEINSLLTRLEISFEKISQFSSDASHELKTPLTIIRGEIEVALRKTRSSKEYEQTLSSCLDEVLVIQQTIDDLLFLAKNESDFTHNFTACKSDEITLEAIKELKNLAYVKHITLKTQLNECVIVQGHATLLKIALKNIIKNAITFSHENQTVLIKNELLNDTFCIVIQDFGIGIAQEEQSKIFEKFYRTDKSRNKESGGTGLGMAIVKKIIQLHHGEIHVISQENQGTSIILEFKDFKRVEDEY